MTSTNVILVAIASILLAGCTSLANNSGDGFVEVNQVPSENSPKSLVDESKIVSGGPPKDGIPPLDNPKFVSVNKADNWISDDEIVFGLNHKGVDRAYPQQIMVWHEIVNDELGGDPISVTYCPLCGSSIAFDRRLDGVVYDFGTSGKLYNSNLVMYDRQTDSYWSQIQGRAIVGELVGKQLTQLALQALPWKVWKEKYPDSEILSKDTGFVRTYGRDPYGSYYEDNDALIFPVENSDSRLPSKAFIIGIEVNGMARAYPEFVLKERGVIDDIVGGQNIRIEMDEDGFTTIKNVDTGENLGWERDFWFAWFAFHPDTELYEKVSE